MRFGMVVTDDFIEQYVNSIIKDINSEVLIIEVDERIVAACHVAFIGKEAEFGLSVDVEHRGNGFAQQLFSRAMTLAEARGVKAVFMHCLHENAAVRHIATKNKMIVVSEYGESDARLVIDSPRGQLLSAYHNESLNKIALVDMLVRNNLRMMEFILKLMRNDDNG